MFLGVLHQLEDEAGDAHYGIWTDAPDGVPLQFRDSVADTYHPHSELPEAKPVGKSGHEPLVDGAHELKGVARLQSGTIEGLGLIPGQPLEVLVSAAECNRIPEGAGCGDIVYHFITRAAQEILTVKLEVLFLRKGDLDQVFKMPDLADVSVESAENPLVIRRTRLEILQRFLQFFLLERLDGFNALEFNVIIFIEHHPCL